MDPCQQTTDFAVVNEHACLLLYAPTMVAGDAEAGAIILFPQHTTERVDVMPHAKSSPAAMATAPNNIEAGGVALP